MVESEKEIDFLPLEEDDISGVTYSKEGGSTPFGDYDSNVKTLEERVKAIEEILVIVKHAFLKIGKQSNDNRKEIADLNNILKKNGLI